MNIEQLITKTNGKNIWRRFIKGVEKYNMIQPHDHIAVCISGGKDSMLLAKLLKMAADYGMYDIKLEFIMMDGGYSPQNVEIVHKNAKELGIPLDIFHTEVFDDVEKIGEGSPCFFCSRMRRGYLYRKAKELGCNKIALGHHYDDVIQTILMSMLYGAQIQTMMPLVNSENIENMQLIRPMYLIREEDIIKWCNESGMEFVKCACRLNTKGNSEDTTRLKVKNLIKTLTDENPAVAANIFGSVENVRLDKIISYKKDGETYSVLK